MRSEIVDVLLEIGIPANVKGFTYIHDAMDLFDTDAYYSSGKILLEMLPLLKNVTQNLPVWTGLSVMLLKPLFPRETGKRRILSGCSQHPKF